jgi:hypothetical protein
MVQKKEILLGYENMSGESEIENRNYERCLAATVFEHALKKFKNQTDFGRKLWPGKSTETVNTTIRALKTKNSRGKPQGIYVKDAVQMAKAIEIPLSSLFLEVETKMRLGWKEEADEQELSFCLEDSKQQKKQRIPRAAISTNKENGQIQPSDNGA